MIEHALSTHRTPIPEIDPATLVWCPSKKACYSLTTCKGWEHHQRQHDKNGTCAGLRRVLKTGRPTPRAGETFIRRDVSNLIEFANSLTMNVDREEIMKGLTTLPERKEKKKKAAQDDEDVE